MIKVSHTWIGLLLRLLVSQQHTVLSFEPDTTTEDSSLYLTQFTVAACCLNLRFTLPSDTSHITTDLSAPQDTNSLSAAIYIHVKFVHWYWWFVLTCCRMNYWHPSHSLHGRHTFSNTIPYMGSTVLFFCHCHMSDNIHRPLDKQ